MPDELKLYRVTWEIDVYAKSPLLAAKSARYYQTLEGTSAVVFDTADEEGNIVRVDLMEEE